MTYIHIYTDSITWHENNRYHNTRGYAIINNYGKSWWKLGKLHRLDGPAVEYFSKDIRFTETPFRWFVEHKEMDQSQFISLNFLNLNA
jgi:hypothetical protein